MEGNPLEILGVPKLLVARERDLGSLERVLALAKGNFKTFATQYHPDKPGGDVKLMNDINFAMEELQDPDALQYYVDEYLDDSLLASLRRRKSVDVDRERDRQIAEALIPMLRHVNQFEVLGIELPTSFIMRPSGKYMVVDAVSPTTAKLYASDVPESATLGSLAANPSQSSIEYVDGHWTERYLVRDEEHIFVHDKLTYLGEARLVGGFTEQFVRETSSSYGKGKLSDFALMSSDQKIMLEWEEPRLTWYLPGFKPDLRKRMHAVMCNAHGRLLNGGIIDAIAPM